MSASEPGGDHALARVQAEHPGRRGRRDLHPAGQRQLARRHALVQQVHPVLDAGHPVGDLGEVAPAEFLLVLEAERAVVGGHHRQVVGAQAPPQRRPGAPWAAAAARRRTWPPRSPAGPGRRGTGTGTAGRSRRTRSARCRGPAATASSACRADRCTMYSGAAGHLGQRDRPRRGLALQLRRPGQAVLAPGRCGPPPAPARPAGRSRCRSPRAS